MRLAGELHLQKARTDPAQHFLVARMPFRAEPVGDELQHRCFAGAERPGDDGEVPHPLSGGEIDVVGPLDADQAQAADTDAGKRLHGDHPSQDVSSTGPGPSTLMRAAAGPSDPSGLSHRAVCSRSLLSVSLRSWRTTMPAAVVKEVA